MIRAETLELLEWSRLCQHLATFAATKLGAVAARNLQIPTTKAQSLALLAQTEEVYQLESTEAGLSFEGITDIGDSIERAERGGILSGAEYLNIATTLAGVRRLRRAIDDREDVPTLTDLIEPVRTYPELEQEIHRCIDDRGKVADRASPKLEEVRRQIKDLRDKIYQILQRIVQRSGAVQEPVITQRGDRFVIPVKAPQKDQIPGIVHDTSSTGATLYVEPHSVVGLSNKLRQYRRTEQVQEEAVLRALSEQVAAVSEDLEQVLAIATALDLATARARYSAWLEASPPQFIAPQQEPATTVLQQLRHPLLIWQQRHEQGADVVPIDARIQPDIRTVVITGPNTGGKTATLKSIGLAALMAKAGLFVPAKAPVQLPWFSQILADIGDEQSLEQNLSTFSGHVRRIGRILEALPLAASSEPHSALVLLDEVGAGTDPAEGSALAIALLKYLSERALLTVATTHYGELKALKYQDPRFENASVEFDDQTLSPTYRLLWGIPGRSNALTIAQRLGLNVAIIEQAKELMGGYSEDVNEIIAALETQRREQEAKNQEATQLLEQTERFYEEVSAKATALQQRERELKLSQEQAVQEAITQAKEEIAKVIRRLQQGPQTAQNAQKATEALNHIAEQQLPQAEVRTPKPGYLPQVGERVKIPRLNQTAEVLTAPDDDGELTVRFGVMKMTVSLADVESLDGKKAEPVKKATKAPAPPPTAKPAPTVRTSQNTLDLRGSRVADAEIELDQAISNAVNTGAVWIIHGKGTGRLRQGVHEWLQQHPLVKRFELAPQNEGGAGVTIAYLN
ncbi:MAG: endonuclease MutS2 [Cyanophyceae cyanobacterium]